MKCEKQITEIADFLIKEVEKPAVFLQMLTDFISGAMQIFPADTPLRVFLLEFIDNIIIPWMEAGDQKDDSGQKALKQEIFLIAENTTAKKYFHELDKAIMAYNFYSEGGYYEQETEKKRAACVSFMFQVGGLAISINEKIAA